MASSSGEAPTYRFRFDNCVFDEPSMLLTMSGQVVALERRPLEVLQALLRHADEVLTKDELLSLVWGDVAIVENVVANAVAKLRKALGEPLSERIVTHPRIGYRFSGPVERTAAGRRLVSQFELKQGGGVAGREHLRLDTQLSESRGRETWLTRHTKTGEVRVFKFAADGQALSALKREVTLFRVLSASAARDTVARIHDWNFASPPFYTESEFGGQTLDVFVSSEFDSDTPTATRIALASALADATARVHEAGVLHKDLKPTNILVEKGAQADAFIVRLIDYGSGALLDKDQLEALNVTPLGLTDETDSSLRSTRAYIAPEIFKGASPSVRSDVYALGVIIYQIMSGDGAVPMPSNWIDTLNDDILSEDIAKATHPDPESRLASAALLTQRLRTIGERRTKRREADAQARRQAELQAMLDRTRARRPWIAAAAIALAAGLISSVWLTVQAQQSRAEAQSRALQAEVALQFITEIIYSADPKAPGGQPDATVESALARAAGEIDDRFGSDPLGRGVVAAALAQVHVGLQNHGDAVVMRQRALDGFIEAEGRSGDRALEAGYALAGALRDAGQLDKSDRVLAQTDRALKAARRPSFVARYQSAYQKGVSLLMRGDLAATEHLERALELEDDHVKPPRNFIEVDRWETLRMMLAQNYGLQGRHDEAVTALEPIASLFEATPEAIPDWRHGRFLFIYGYTLFLAGNLDEAAEAVARARKLNLPIYGADSPYIGQIDTVMGLVDLERAEYATALDSFNRARATLCAPGSERASACLSARQNVAVTLRNLDRSGEALPEFEALHGILADIHGEDSPFVMRVGYDLAMILLDRGEFDAAGAHIELIDRAIIATGDPVTRWDLRYDGLAARHRYLVSRAPEDRQALDASLAVMREAGGTEDQIAPFLVGLEAK